MWPQFIIDSFTHIPANSSKNEFYGAWNSILNFSFNIEEGYEVVPQKAARHQDTIDFVITKNRSTILFLEIKAPTDLSQLYARTEADGEMRKRFAQLHDSDAGSPSRLNGVSAFGTRLRFYSLDTENRSIFPSLAAQPLANYIVDVAPEDWWEMDILGLWGYIRFMEIVEDAKSMD